MCAHNLNAQINYVFRVNQNKKLQVELYIQVFLTRLCLSTPSDFKEIKI